MVLIPDVLGTASDEISSHLLSDDELHAEDFPFSKFLMQAALRLLQPLGFRYFELAVIRGIDNMLKVKNRKFHRISPNRMSTVL
ncbi:hypothetical protein TNCV_2900101 [Trichonephila clavipes]|nr:hypothetical protein TNCV_2900101 [Trichonephila clavipes]